MTDDQCPFCQSTHTQGDSAPQVALRGPHDIEQLSTCLDCRRYFVSLYVFQRNVPVAASSVFEEPQP